MASYYINFTDPEVPPFNVNAFTTDGPQSPTTTDLSTTAVRASTSLILYGKGHANYGERIQENLINLLENFSGSTPPVYPRSGQTWFARITYALIEYGSPDTLKVFRWSDETESWIELTNVGASDPVAADEIKTIGGRPATVVDGSFWLDRTSSPAVPELYLGVNKSTSNFSPLFLKREMEDLSGLVTEQDLLDNRYLPQKQLKVYDGLRWKNAGSVFTSFAPPQRPSEGDLWYASVGSPSLDNQLFIYHDGEWRTTGYVDITGDTMTGILEFRDFPNPVSLIIWEGKGDETTGSDLHAIGNALLSADDSFYIHIGGSPNTSAFEVARGSNVRDGSEVSLFRVLNDGTILSALGSPPAYTALVQSGSGNVLVNKDYVNSTTSNIQSQVDQNTSDIADNAADILILAGGNLEAKVNRSGDIMTGPLVFMNVGSPTGNQFHSIDSGMFRITNVGEPLYTSDAATKQYVDDSVLGIFGSPSPFSLNDGVVSNVTWTPEIRELRLSRTEGLPDLVSNLIHNHPTSEINHTIANSVYLTDLFPDGVASQEQINEVAFDDLENRIERAVKREVFEVGLGSPISGGGSPTLNLTQFTLTGETYRAGTNKLQVYVNGIKQYANERAYQKIKFNAGTTATTLTGLFDIDIQYVLAMTVDGSPEIMTATGEDLQTVQDIIDQINLQIASVTAVWDSEETAIYVYSNTTGIGSSVDITDGTGSPLAGGSPLMASPAVIDLLLALAATGSPTGIYTFGNISPAAGGPVSTITRELGYREVVDHTISLADAEYGELCSSIVFNSPLNPGDVVEVNIL